MKRTFLITVLVATAATLFLCKPSRAEAKCPWLNTATAAGVLGGNVQMAVTAPADPGPVKGVGQASYPDQVRMDRFDVACEFRRKVGSDVYTLRIVVKTMNDQTKEFAGYVAQCDGSTVALKGIGNEAVQCVRKSGSDNPGSEQVIARVRDRAFVLSIHRGAVVSGGANADELRDDTRNMAEQVAGSLF